MRKSIVIKTIMACMFIAGGLLMGTRAIGMLHAQSFVTDADMNALTSIRAEVQELKAERLAQGDVVLSDSAIATINLGTDYDPNVEKKLRELAVSSNLEVRDNMSFVKKREDGVQKAFYVFEGYGGIAQIAEFLSNTQMTGRAMLIEEVYLSDSAVNPGAKEYRIVLLDAYDKGQVVKAEESNTSTSVPSESKPESISGDSSIENTSGDNVNNAGESDLGEEEDSVETSSEIVNDDNSDSVPESMPDSTAVTTDQQIEDDSSNRNPETDDSNQTTQNTSHEHIWSDWGWKTIATHDNNGEMSRVCYACFDIESTVVEKTDKDHSWGTGACGARVCTICGEKEAAADHKLGVPTILSEPNCYIQGYAEQVCMNTECSEKNIIEIAMLEHSWTNDEAGLRKCKICGASESGSMIVDVS